MNPAALKQTCWVADSTSLTPTAARLTAPALLFVDPDGLFVDDPLRVFSYSNILVSGFRNAL